MKQLIFSLCKMMLQKTTMSTGICRLLIFPWIISSMGQHCFVSSANHCNRLTWAFIRPVRRTNVVDENPFSLHSRFSPLRSSYPLLLLVSDLKNSSSRNSVRGNFRNVCCQRTTSSDEPIAPEQHNTPPTTKLSSSSVSVEPTALTRTTSVSHKIQLVSTQQSKQIPSVSLGWRKRWQRRMGVVMAGVGFLSSATRAIATTQLTRWKPTVETIRKYLQQSGIDQEMLAVLNVRLLDNIIILSRVEQAILQGKDRRDIVAARTSISMECHNGTIPPMSDALRYGVYMVL